MVQSQVASRGVRSRRVLDALRSVPRELFLPPGLRHRAYEDTALPIGRGQTISHPYIVARMIDALDLCGHERVLEVGTGSGYGTALLGELVDEVHTLERDSILAREAEVRLGDLAYNNVHVHCTDGTLGWTSGAPYDAIMVTAAAPDVPRPLYEQLLPGGRLVIPVGRDLRGQTLLRLRRSLSGPDRRDCLEDVRFVPLIGNQGWHPRVGAARS
jgi:protein-L-isoaspartate(D-aspartate) O-methyltransferase